MTIRQRIVAVGAALVLAGIAQAQRFGESVQVSVVEVPVTVVDRAGNPVKDLKKEDFEIYDDGKRVPIDYFEVVDMVKATATPIGEDTAPPPRIANRHFLLLFDIANSSPGTIGRASEAAAEFVRSQLSPRDLAAVATFTAENGLKMLTSFTNNRVLLADAIRTLGDPNYFKVADPLLISAWVPKGSGPMSTGSESGKAGAPLNDAMNEGARELNRMSETASDTEKKNRLRIQISNFGSVARVLDKVPGQKQVVLLSEGFDARLVQGRENISESETRSETDAIMAGEVWNVDSEKRFGSTSSSRDISDMAQLFRRSDVVLHAIDIKGLRGSVDAGSAGSGAARGSNESLFLLTSPTGGSVFKNANDLGENFGKMLHQQEVVYLLAFQAKSTGKPGRFHEIKVKTKAGRASHRAGYYEEGGRISDLERTLNLADILITDAPIRDVEIDLTPAALPGPGGKARVPVIVQVPGRRLLEGVPGNTATANLYLYAFDAQSQVVDFLQQRISLDLAQAGESVRKHGVRYFGTLRLPPGKYAIKSVVRVEESSRLGFDRHDLEVPAFDSAVVSGPYLFSDPEDWVMLVGPTRGDDYAYPFSAGESKYIPRSVAEVSPETEYKLALFLYRVPLENLEVKPELVDPSGSVTQADVKLLGRTAADERGGVKLLFSYKPAALAAGEHTLRFRVKPKDGAESVVSIPVRSSSHPPAAE
jgi:VWFA-related protein